jgi:hypothetical protein
MHRDPIGDSLLLKGLQCKKLYWLERHKPELKTGDAMGEILKKMIKEAVETEAKKRFLDAFIIQKKSVKGALRETQAAISRQEGVILDARFRYKNILIHVDAMVWEETGYALYEIKSSAGVKDVYYNQATIKWAILTLCKVLPVRSYILHINNRYCRTGPIDPWELFMQKNITQVVKRRQEEILRSIDELLSMEKDKPKIHIGAWCNDPYECEFKSYCWRFVPTPSVFDLHKLPGKKKFELYRQGMVTFDQIPANLELSPGQRRQIAAQEEGRDFIDRERIAEFLKGIKYPVYFLDFETYQQAVPRFENLRPYEQIPFQFSLHIVRKPGAEAEHIEFLAEAGEDPRYKLAARLVNVMGDSGTILAYNQSFEKGVIARLAEHFEDLSPSLAAMLPRFMDLMVPFEKGMYYTRAMNGRHSIKAVLPALVPELSYKALTIGHGGEAMNAYATLHLEKNPKAAERVRENLLEYCQLDTLAMVRIWEKLKATVHGNFY